MIKTKSRLVNTKFWDDKYTSNLDPIEKLLFLYFLTNPLTNLIGVYEIELRRIAFDTGIDKEMVIKIIERFSKDEKIYYYEGYLIIKNFVKFQNEGSEKVKIGIKNLFEALPEKIKKFNSGLVKGIDTVSYINTNINTNSNININPNINSNLILRKDKPEKTPALFSNMKNVFLEYYQETKTLEYYFTGKCAGALKQLTNKLKKICSAEKQSDEDILKAFKYMLDNITDAWILDNLELTTINSKFNQIISQIKNGKSTNTVTGNNKGFDPRKNTWFTGVN